MCEDQPLRMTGLSIDQHQDLTIANFLTLRDLAPELPIIPVVQGWLRPHYARCVEKFAAADVNLTKEPLVGVGSICRRPSTTSQNHLSGWPAAIHRFGMLDTEAVPGPDDQTVQGHVLVGVVVLASPMNERVLTVPFPGLPVRAER
ncbi:hypothetical protein [Streptomyces sp. NPDC050485]|uniref:deazapurine DNA modification protein DpdA family protein n=1 Tax=Streptomyces sp. NPDC050485 TaxID=3365617 RepID=UPI00378DE80E